MKTFKYICFLIIGLSVIGCSDLEEKPITQLSPDSYFSDLTLDQIDGFVSGAYAHMLHRNFMSREMTQALMYRSDMMAIGRTSNQPRTDHDNFTVQADNGLISGGSNTYWKKVYQIIAAANEAVQKSAFVEGADETAKKELIARARFARAFSYFHLVRQFGDIPYLDENTLLGEASVAVRTPVAEVYANIISDLEYCKTNLPNTQASRALPAKSAASAYLALVYLTMGQFDDANFQKAYDEAKDLIGKEGTYNLGLETNFQDLYNAAKIDSSLEPIFVLDFTGANDSDQGRDYQGAFTGIRSDEQYLKADGSFSGGGWSVEVPALKVFTSWNALDYRRAVTFDDKAIQGGAIADYMNFTDGNGDAVNRPHVAKYTRMANGTATEGNLRASQSNYMMMRYAEVLLIGAEAANEVGQTGDAETWANRVMSRARAGGVISGGINDGNVIASSAIPTNLSGLSKDDFRTRVLEERRLELAYEMKRWYDIARRKLGATAFGSDGLESEVSTEANVGPGPKSFNPAKDYLFPIPLDEIVRNPNLTQNAGY
jgi:hypothetical protein